MADEIARRENAYTSARLEISTGQGTMTLLCGREGNRRSGVALAMRRRLSGISNYSRSSSCQLRNTDKHPA